MSIKRHVVSFKYAFEGLKLGLSTQPNFRIHLFLSLLSLLAGYYFHVSYTEFLLILFLTGGGLAIEYLNTAIEYTVDLMTDKHHLLAKYAKDCAAAGMLTYSIFAAIIAFIIFAPKIIVWLSI